jgi:hypothetical protein
MFHPPSFSCIKNQGYVGSGKDIEYDTAIQPGQKKGAETETQGIKIARPGFFQENARKYKRPQGAEPKMKDRRNRKKYRNRHNKT